jgi:hypothetical protein
VNELSPSLERFQGQLEAAIGRATRIRRRRRLAYRLGTAAAAAVGVVVVLGLAGVVTARAPSVVDRAAAALTTGPNAILHIQIRGERTEADGSVTTWQSEGWRATNEPFLQRHEISQSDGRRVEWAYDGQLHQIYDAGSNTVYEVSKEQLGEALAALGAPGKPATRADAAKEVEARLGSSAPMNAAASGDELRDGVLVMLESGDARADGHVVVDGRDAIRIVSVEKRVTYLVDAKTYDPIEWRSEEVGGSTTTLRFLAYEELGATDANRSLVDLRAQHPTASVSSDPRAAASALGLR